MPIPRPSPWRWADVCRLSPYAGIKGGVGCVRNYGHKGLTQRRYTYIIHAACSSPLLQFKHVQYSASTDNKGCTCTFLVYYSHDIMVSVSHNRMRRLGWSTGINLNWHQRFQGAIIKELHVLEGGREEWQYCLVLHVVNQ